MEAKVYAVAGGKGGVGKTTTAVNVGVALAESGLDVAVVDADIGMTNLGAMVGIDHDPGIHRVLAGEATVADATVEGPGGATFLPGAGDLDAIREADPDNLADVVETLRDTHDVVVVDTGAGLSHESLIPFALADGILLVTTDGSVSVADAKKTADLASRVDGEVVGVVLNKATADADIDGVEGRLDAELLGVIPRDDVATRNEPLVVNAPDSYAADACRRLAARLDVPEPEPDDEAGEGTGDGDGDTADAGTDAGTATDDAPDGDADAGEAGEGDESESRTRGDGDGRQPRAGGDSVRRQ